MARFAASLREIRSTLTLAAPIVVGQVSQMLMGVLDSAMIGHAGTRRRRSRTTSSISSSCSGSA